MAVDFKVEHSRGSEYLFLPENILIKPDLNGRHETPDIEGLISSIVEQGQIQPVVVRNESGSPVLVAGFSRWRAVSEINKRGLTPVAVKLRCTYFKGSEFDGFLANIQENKARNEITSIDDAHNIAKLEKWGQTIDQISNIYRQSSAWVKSRLKLISLEPEVKKAIKDGKVKTSAANEIAKLSAEQQRNIVKNGTVGKKDIEKLSGKKAKMTIRDIKKFLRETISNNDESKEVREFSEILLEKI